MNGKTKKIIQWTAGVIFSLLIIFVILISSFEIVLYSDMSVYRKEYEKYEVLDELDMTMDDAMYVTREMMDYLRGDKHYLLSQKWRGKDKIFLMNRIGFI